MGNVTLKCYNCGKPVIVAEGSYIGVCSECMAEIPVPKQMDSSADILSQANELLSQSRFEDAKQLYREAMIRAPYEAAACWGFAVSEYGIKFVQDPDTAELLPTMNRLSQEQFSQHLYVKKAIEYAPDPELQQFYTKQGRLIDEIQSRSLEISQKEDPYDVFICYKKTEQGEKRTADSRMAADLYKELDRRGYKTFFAEVTLALGVEYEPRIFAALNSAKVLLAIGSKEEYYEAAWVKNEWSRYVNLIQTEQEQGGTGRLLIPVYYNLTHDQLPEPLRAMPQSVDMSGHANARQELFGLISAHFSSGSKEDTGDLRRQVRGQLSGAPRMETSVENYVARGTIELVNGEFAKAEEMFRQANEMEPSADAYLGLMMCSRGIAGKEALHQYDVDIREDALFLLALEHADAEQSAQLEAISRTCLDNQQWSRVCNEQQSGCVTAVQEILRKAKSFALNKPSCQTGSQMQDFVTEAKHPLRALAGESELAAATRWFILWGNLFPAVSFMVNDLLETLGYAPTIKWIIIPGTLALLAFYVIFFANLLGKISFLEEGCIGTIIRFGAGFVISMMLIQTMNDSDITKPYLLISLIASVLYYLIRGRKRGKLKRKVKANKRRAAELLKQAETMAQSFRRETLETVQTATTGYRQYYQPEEWQSMQKQWEQDVHKVCSARMEQLREGLEQIRAGKVEKNHA